MTVQAMADDSSFNPPATTAHNDHQTHASLSASLASGSLRRPTTISTTNSIKALKDSLTLDLNAEQSTKKSLETPDIIRYLQLSSPEFEKILSQGAAAGTTPTPQRILFPTNVTEQEEAYTRGFLDALRNIHSQRGAIPGFVPACPGDNSLLLSPTLVSIVSSLNEQSSPSTHFSSTSASLASVDSPLQTTEPASSAASALAALEAIGISVNSCKVGSAAPGFNAALLRSPQSHSTSVNSSLASVIMQTMPQLHQSLMNMSQGHANYDTGLTMASAFTKQSPSSGMYNPHPLLIPKVQVNGLEPPISIASSYPPQYPEASCSGRNIHDTSAYDQQGTYLTATHTNHLNPRSPPSCSVSAPLPTGEIDLRLSPNRGVKRSSPTSIASTSPKKIKEEDGSDDDGSINMFTEEGTSAISSLPLNMRNQEMLKLERKRMRNRLAASKCRQKKLEMIDELKGQVDTLQDEIDALNRSKESLKREQNQLKSAWNSHKSSGCS